MYKQLLQEKINIMNDMYSLWNKQSFSKQNALIFMELARLNSRFEDAPKPTEKEE